VPAHRAFSVLFVHKKRIVIALKPEDFVVQLVRHAVVQRQGVAHQKIHDERNKAEAENGKHGPGNRVGTSAQRILDDPYEDDHDQYDCSEND